MPTAFQSVLPAATPLRGRIIGLYALLAAANVGAWAWALAAFHAHPVLLGTALLAYGLGLRHAVDADHIAAIDNVTRKLMHDGQQPIGVGFFFALGHSTVVVLASIAVATTAQALTTRFAAFRSVGAVVSTLVSAFFLLVVAVMNIFIFASVYRAFRHVRAGGRYMHEDADVLLSGGGLLARILRPLFGMISSSWHMYPLGFLFGLGFDTATEITLLGISATQASQGMPLWSMLVFPALFTVGMTLIDTTDGILMIGAYGWASVRPIRKLYYNLTMTFLSVVVAVLVGGVEALTLARQTLGLRGWFWSFVGRLSDTFGSVGYLIIGVFILTWLGAALVYHLKGYDELGDSEMAH